MSESVTQLPSNSRVYVDTMIFYEYLRTTEPATIQFFERIRQGELWAYTAVLTFDELAYRMTLAHIRDKYTGSPNRTTAACRATNDRGILPYDCPGFAAITEISQFSND